MIVKREFVSVGVNRVANSLDWGGGGRIAYGGHNSVIIYDPEAAEIESTLVGHLGLVNAVLWVERSGMMWPCMAAWAWQLALVMIPGSEGICAPSLVGSITCDLALNSSLGSIYTPSGLLPAHSDQWLDRQQQPPPFGIRGQHHQSLGGGGAWKPAAP